MSRKKPNIITPHNDKGAFNDLVLNVFSDSFVTSHTPDSISLDGTLFTLTLLNKKLTSLINKHNFISDQQSLNHVADEVRLENLSTDLQSLLLKLKNGNQEKDSFIKN
mgnify:CR=1 FL=1